MSKRCSVLFERSCAKSVTVICYVRRNAAALVELPDNVSAAALSIAISAGGSCKSVKTVPLLSAKEGVAAMKKASTCGYQPVGQAAKA